MSETTRTCGLCGEPMPPGEDMFKFHGYSGPCPKPPLPMPSPAPPEAQETLSIPALQRRIRLDYGQAVAVQQAIADAQRRLLGELLLALDITSGLWQMAQRARRARQATRTLHQVENAAYHEHKRWTGGAEVKVVTLRQRLERRRAELGAHHAD